MNRLLNHIINGSIFYTSKGSLTKYLPLVQNSPSQPHHKTQNPPNHLSFHSPLDIILAVSLGRQPALLALGVHGYVALEVSPRARRQVPRVRQQRPLVVVLVICSAKLSYCVSLRMRVRSYMNYTVCACMSYRVDPRRSQARS